MKCQACSTETVMPFRCQYCGGMFCAKHRLPENHSCPNINSARTSRQEQVFTSSAPNSYNYSYVYGQQPIKRGIVFSKKEVKHIAVAAILVIGIGFSIGLYGFGLDEWSPFIMAGFAAIMTASFLIHEIAHKVIAQKHGMWAEFRLTTWGAILTLISVFLPFKMIAPGAMMISGSLPKGEDIVKISIAGPLTNILFSASLLGIVFVLPISGALFVMLFFAAYINAFMAVFNLIPFGILDGYKIFSFNKMVWAAAFVTSLILTIVTYWIMFV